MPIPSLAASPNAAGLLAKRQIAGRNVSLQADQKSEVRAPPRARWRDNDAGRRFASSNQIARGLVEGFREQEVRVPGDVGVVGVDNWTVMVEAARPPLTSVDLNLRTIGEVAARRLVQAMEGEPTEPGVERLERTLVVRQSTEVN